MDWINKVAEIKHKLTSAGYVNLVNRIIEAQMILGTSGEMYLLVMDVLLDVKRKGGGGSLS